MTSVAKIFSVLLFSVLIAACSERVVEHHYQGLSMGTSWQIKLFEEIGDEQFAEVVAQLSARLNSIEQAMSTYLPDSEVSRFNISHSTEWQTVSPEVVEVVAYAQRVSELTEGAFDITVAPLVKLWGFAGETIESLPTDAEVAQLRGRLGYKHLMFRHTPPALRKGIPQLHIDLSAIAKGFAVDKAVDVLHEHKFKNYLIEVGGELRASGVNKDLKMWHIGVEKPVPGWREVMREVQLDGASIATSGDYRNFIEIDGKRYSHEIDPRSGQPLMYQGGSVTVIAPTAMQADAWATGLFVLGRERGIEIARSQQLAVYYIEQSDDGFIQTMNKKFSQYLAME